MRRSKVIPKNGVELLQLVLMSIAETAPKHSFNRHKDDVLLNLNSGPLDGNVIRFHRNEYQDIELQFHFDIHSAFAAIPGQAAFYMLEMQLQSTSISDAKCGKQFRQSFNVSGADLLRQCKTGTKIIPFIIQFLSLLESLPCHHIWTSELDDSWDKVIVHAVMAPREPVTA
jgi:hypothetical protein